MTDLDVGLADHAFAGAELIALDVVHIAFVVQVSRLAPEEDIGRALLALIHLVGDDVGHRIAALGGRQAHVGQDADEDELGVLGGGGFVGHCLTTQQSFHARQ